MMRYDMWRSFTLWFRINYQLSEGDGSFLLLYDCEMPLRFRQSGAIAPLLKVIGKSQNHLSHLWRLRNDLRKDAKAFDGGGAGRAYGSHYGFAFERFTQ